MPTIAKVTVEFLNCESFPTCISKVICYGYILSASRKKKIVKLFVLSGGSVTTWEFVKESMYIMAKGVWCRG